MKRIVSTMCAIAIAAFLSGCCCGGGGGYPSYYGPTYGGQLGGGCANGSCGTGIPQQGGFYPQGASLYGTSPAVQAGVGGAPIAAGYAPQQAYLPLETYPRF